MTWFGVVTSTLSLVVASASFLVFEATSARQRAGSRSALLAEVTAANAAAALSFFDPETARQALAALDVEGTLHIACLYDFNGEVFAEFAPAGRDASGCPPVRKSSIAFETGRVAVFRPVMLGDERVGAIYLQLGADSVGQRLSGYAVIGGVVLIASIGLSVVVSAPLRRRITGRLLSLTESSQDIAAGDLTRSPSGAGDDEIGVLSRAFAEMTDGLREVVASVKESAATVRQVSRNLAAESAAMRTAAESEIEAVAKVHESARRTATAAQNLNHRAESLAHAVERTAGDVQRLDTSSEDVASQMDVLGQTVVDTVSAVEQLSANIESIGASVDQLRSSASSTTHAIGEIDRTADEARRLAGETHDLAQEVVVASRAGGSSVDQTVEAIDGIRTSFSEIQEVAGELSKNSTSIQDVTRVIDEFAAGSRLLALNAQIIAAQAGEHGRAFSVVAQEVDLLAGRAARSVSEIEGLVQGAQQGTARLVDVVERGASRVDLGVSRSRDAGSALRTIQEKANRSSELVSSIASGANAQTRQVSITREEMQRLVECVEEITRAIQEQQRANKWLNESAEGVRQLSDDVKRATQEQRAGSASINEATRGVSDLVELTVQATREQIDDSNQIGDAMETARARSTETQEATGKIEQIVAMLGERAEDLEKLIAHFKI